MRLAGIANLARGRAAYQALSKEQRQEKLRLAREARAKDDLRKAALAGAKAGSALLAAASQPVSAQEHMAVGMLCSIVRFKAKRAEGAALTWSDLADWPSGIWRSVSLDGVAITSLTLSDPVAAAKALLEHCRALRKDQPAAPAGPDLMDVLPADVRSAVLSHLAAAEGSVVRR
jgi:hypothetical protein